MRILGNGNVGIGVVNPSTKLHVNGAIRLEAEDVPAIVSVPDAANLTGTYIAFGIAGTTSDCAFLRQIGGANNYTLALDLHDDGTESFIIRNVQSAANPDTITNVLAVTNTNVGIGTNNPINKFDVRGVCRIDDAPATNTYSFSQAYQLDVRSTTSSIQSWVKGTAFIAAISCATPPANGGGWNAGASVFYVTRDTSTLRSINAMGTINASGADYAEYMRLEDGITSVSKGDIVGVTSNGEITNVYAKAHSFMVKSTDPSYVGGDTWGTEDTIGKKPVHPPETATAAELAKYQQELDDWNAQLESVRKQYDRIAFSGQVPVNVYNAKPGDHIVPVATSDGKISGIPVPDSSITFEQYKKSVGVVFKILEDGRAFIRVK